MATDVDLLKQELVAVSHEFYRRGWSLATSGNFSARIDQEHFLITTSGKDKGSLNIQDFVLVDLHGNVGDFPSEKASAETLLHSALYRLDSRTVCILHTHSVYATILSPKRQEVILEGYEMLKALAGVSTHQHREVIPVLPNTQDLSALSEDVIRLLREYPNAHAFLIAGHGFYTWGESIFKARTQMEALEFMLECEVLNRNRARASE
ncbi:methylthioribulose 1-phosphate dehydratase [bacterium]|nr:methylthioribulose 1-phosphate dehydratase [bacterium]